MIEEDQTQPSFWKDCFAIEHSVLSPLRRDRRGCLYYPRILLSLATPGLYWREPQRFFVETIVTKAEVIRSLG